MTKKHKISIGIIILLLLGVIYTFSVSKPVETTLEAQIKPLQMEIQKIDISITKKQAEVNQKSRELLNLQNERAKRQGIIDQINKYFIDNGKLMPETEVQKLLNTLIPTANANSAHPVVTGMEVEQRLTEFVKQFNPKMTDETIGSVVQFAKDNGIDPAFPFCMAYADSHIGTEGKGARTNNPCNWSHDDSGTHTYEFDTMETGMKKCVSGLLAQQYQNTQQIGDLSIGGRKLLYPNVPQKGYKELAPIGKMWWASSPVNWNTNVLSCMSTIYNKPIGVDFYFRNTHL